ncbi:MAG: proline dehydrogenase family protein [Gemmatimonadales bacterium]
MRTALLWLSERQGVFNFIKRNGLARTFASRFVAGETLDTAVEAVRVINRKEITASLDLLGESVARQADAEAARDEYLRILERISETGVHSNASLKLTQMGFDIDEELCFRNLKQILDQARLRNLFVRIDMESSEYTQRTLDFFYNRFYQDYAGVTGVVIQSCLRRSEKDVDQLIERTVRVRICKGAYLEPPSVAFPDKADVDRNYVTLMERLLEHGNYPGVATHDEAIINHAIEFVERRKIPPERFEFQMLYGVRRDLQEKLRKGGYNMRVYIPFGGQWYPYLMRRLAERPANIAFMLANVLREGVRRR